MKLMLESGGKVNSDYTEYIYDDKRSAIGYILEHIIQCNPDDTILLSECKATLDLLLDYGGNININTDGMESKSIASYLMYAIQNNHIHVIHILLQCKNLDLNITDKPKGLYSINVCMYK